MADCQDWKPVVLSKISSKKLTPIPKPKEKEEEKGFTEAQKCLMYHLAKKSNVCEPKKE